MEKTSILNFEFLSNQDLNGLVKFFNELHEYEKERAKSLGIQMEKSIEEIHNREISR